MTDLLDRARAVAGELPDCEARDVVLALMREVEMSPVVAVKPLDWVPCQRRVLHKREDVESLFSPQTGYEIYPSPKGDGSFSLFAPGDEFSWTTHPTLDAAKATVEAKWRNHIMSHVAARTVADVMQEVGRKTSDIRREALREAAEIAKRLDSDNPGYWKVTRDDVAAAILARAEPAPRPSHPAHFASGGGPGSAVKGVE